MVKWNKKEIVMIVILLSGAILVPIVVLRISFAFINNGLVLYSLSS